MTEIALWLVGIPVGLVIYSYVGYPILLAFSGRSRARGPRAAREWPLVSVSLPAHNEESVIRETLEAWLSVDYPRDKLQIIVISDASTDKTDAIVAQFADQGVELVRLERRGGKTAAENAAAPRLRGEIVVNCDATTRVQPSSLKPLVEAFDDPDVGVASGRDISVGAAAAAPTEGEGRYVGYEMAIRRLETRAGGIIGASGCFYAIRPELHRVPLPPGLSRDFAAALIAKEHGYRAVSVEEATCLVPRTASLRGEFRRKARTISRGLQTLWYKRQLLSPRRHGAFAWKLFSHKVCRWLTPLAAPLALLGLAILSARSRVAAVLLVLGLAGSLLGVVGLLWPEGRRPPRLLGIAGYGFGANAAAVLGWIRAIRGGLNDAIWEPTRRPGIGKSNAGPPPDPSSGQDATSTSA